MNLEPNVGFGHRRPEMLHALEYATRHADFFAQMVAAGRLNEESDRVGKSVTHLRPSADWSLLDPRATSGVGQLIKAPHQD
jgi:hypothetical protein